MDFSSEEILETIRMVQLESLDIRTVTLGVDLHDCASSRLATVGDRAAAKLMRVAGKLVKVCDAVEAEFGVPIVNRRVAVTPVSEIVAPRARGDMLSVARKIDRAAHRLDVDYVGGYTVLVHRGATESDRRLMRSIPRVLANTKRLCASVTAASTKSGINMDAVLETARTIRDAAEATRATKGSGCTKFCVFANAVEDNPFMAGAFHGAGGPETVVNVGVSGPGAVRAALRRLPAKADLGEVAEVIKRITFKITRVGELVGREVSRRVHAEFGIIDLSLAPTVKVGDSVAEVLEAMGLTRVGTHGSTAALALLIDAVKKGGAMGSSYVGGLSGTFIPVSEDAGMIRAVKSGTLSLAKLEAMTAVCSVGIDMVAVPGDTPVETLAGIIADEMAIGVVNNKTTGVRIIPVPGGRPGDLVDFGGLLGVAPVMRVSRHSCADFVRRGGRIPAPLRSLTN